MLFVMHLLEVVIGFLARHGRVVRPARWQPAQGLVEYGLVLVLIAIFAVGAVTVTGNRISTTFHKADCGLRDAQMGRADC
jgi:hypothetical protein